MHFIYKPPTLSARLVHITQQMHTANRWFQDGKESTLVQIWVQIVWMIFFFLKRPAREQRTARCINNKRQSPEGRGYGTVQIIWMITHTDGDPRKENFICQDCRQARSRLRFGRLQSFSRSAVCRRRGGACSLWSSCSSCTSPGASRRRRTGR